MKDFEDFASMFKARFDDEEHDDDEHVAARVALDMLSQYHDWLTSQLPASGDRP